MEEQLYIKLPICFDCLVTELELEEIGRLVLALIANARGDDWDSIGSKLKGNELYCFWAIEWIIRNID